MGASSQPLRFPLEFVQMESLLFQEHLVGNPEQPRRIEETEQNLHGHLARFCPSMQGRKQGHLQLIVARACVGGVQCSWLLESRSMPLTIQELVSEPYCQGHLFEAQPEKQKQDLLDQLNAIDGNLPGRGERFCLHGV